MKKTLNLMMLIGMLLAACAPDTPTPAPADTDTPTEDPTDEATDDPSDAALPDLTFSGFSIEMEGHTPGMCVEAYGPVTTTVCVRNQGEGDAGEFAVSGGVPEWTVDGLPAGEEVCHVYSSNPQEVVIDPADEVTETDKANNTIFLPVATPPAICTPVSEGG